MSDTAPAPLRWVLGPTFAAQFVKALSPPPPAQGVADPPKLDVAVAVVAIDNAAWVARLAIPPYDLATHNQLAELRIYLVPQGHGLPVDAAGFIASSYAQTSADVSGVLAGGEAAVPLPDVADGDYVGQVVLGFFEV